MDGVLNINKPRGPTSHDVVARLRRVVGERKVGHAGTLDPMASGVLLVSLGNATRIVEYLVNWQKSYRTTAILGAETDTQDAAGVVVSEGDASYVTRELLEQALCAFEGEISQVPPMVSAIRHRGQRLYQLARAGDVVERQPRPVRIHSLQLVEFQPGHRVTAILDVDCSKGTYIRTLCSDVGRSLGCGGHMASLVRTRIGKFRVEDAVSPEEVEVSAASAGLAGIVQPIDEVLEEMPVIQLNAEDAGKAVHGATVMVGELAQLQPAGGRVRIHGPGACLLGIGRLRLLSNEYLALSPEKVFTLRAPR